MWTSLVAQMVAFAYRRQQVWGPSQEDRSLEMATHCSIPAWKIPLDRGAGKLWPMGLQRVVVAEQLFHINLVNF